LSQPLLGAALLYVIGILGARLVSVSFWTLITVSVITATAALIWRRGREPLLYALIALCGLTNATLHRAILSPFDLRQVLGSEPHLATIRGKLRDTPVQRVYERGDQQLWRSLARVEVRALRLNKGYWQPVSGEVAVTTPGWLTNQYSGQLVEITGVLALPPPPVAEGTFDYRGYLQLEEIHYLLKTESEADWQQAGPAPGIPLADRFAQWGRAALSLGLPREDESLRLEWALALGWKTALSETACEPFVQAATYHIFAVDGLRIAIVFGIFFSALRAATVPRGVCGAVLLPVIWFYVALTGWPASAIRAAVMLTVVLVGWILRRPSNPLNSLFAAALLILLWQPQQIFQAGFQLSFFVVLCLILTIPPMFDAVTRLTAPDPLLPDPLRFHLPRWLAVPAKYLGDLSGTSLAAWLGSLPLVACYFHIVTPVSVPANVIAVPLCVLVLISNFTSLVVAGWWPSAAVLLNHAGWFGMECIRVSSRWFAKLPLAYWYCPAPTLFGICLFYALLLAIVTGWMFRPTFRKLKLFGFGGAVLVWLVVCWQQLTTTSLTVLPANGGMVIYCDAPGRDRDLLIDAGPSNSVSFITKNFLRGQGVNRLPALVLTHGDIKHTSGAESIIDLFRVPLVYTSPTQFRSLPYRHMLERLQARPGLVRATAPQTPLGDWTLLHPRPDDRFSRADDAAMVLSAQIGTTHVLLLSDLGTEGQAALCERYPDLTADILVAGLPATGEPIGEVLLARTRPHLVVIADSEFPLSEHAGPKLRSRLLKHGVPVLFTSDTGSVTLEFRSQGWRLHAISGRELCGGN
jgi:competence protein ComEC